MSGGMYLAAAGALVQQLRLDVLSNNMANINTIGYKGEKTLFRIEEAPSPSADGQTTTETQGLSPYAPPFTTRIDFSQGALKQTGNPLDVAISGSGFLSVQTPDGVQYTRQGSFTMNDEGVLVTPDGFPVLGEGGEISLETGAVEIDGDGYVYVDGDEVDRLQLTDFTNPDALKKAGNGRFTVSDPTVAGERPQDATISQGYVETANVNVITAMTEMIETSRAFEAYQKVIKSADEATAKSVGEVGKPF
jgi:flagellar basal-body rod protein FlgF